MTSFCWVLILKTTKKGFSFKKYLGEFKDSRFKGSRVTSSFPLFLNQNPFHPAQLDNFNSSEVADAQLIFLIGCQDVDRLGFEGTIFTKMGNALALEEANTNRIQCDRIAPNEKPFIF
jgi:hypothetical protein